MTAQAPEDTMTAMDEREQLARSLCKNLDGRHWEDCSDGNRADYLACAEQLLALTDPRATPAPAEGQRDIAEECRDVYQHSQGAPQIVAAQPDRLAALEAVAKTAEIYLAVKRENSEHPESEARYIAELERQQELNHALARLTPTQESGQ